MRLFNKDLDMTASEFYSKYDISANIPLNVWVDKNNMTKDEKATIRGWETTGGYLKALPYKDACQIWWHDNPKEHGRFLTLPNFTWEIFTSITGIEPEQNEDIDVTVEGKTIKISRKSAIALGLLKEEENARQRKVR